MEMYGAQRYHVTLGPKRTTVSLDNILSILLSLQLGQAPDTTQAHRAVRHWLQARLDENGDYGRCLTSQWLQNEVMLALIPRELDAQYSDWLCRPMDKIVSTVASHAHRRATTAEARSQALVSTPKTR